MPFKTYEIVHTMDGEFAVHYASPNCIRDQISKHRSEADAKAAVKRYEAGDKRRGTTRRSGADIINDLTR